MLNHYKYFLDILFLALLTSNFAFAQKIKTYSVSGKVTDEKGNPLEGVNISVADNNLGTTTNKLGYYRLEFQDSSSLQITYQFIGYTSVVRIIRFSGSTEIELDISLQSNAIPMQEVKIAEKRYEPDIGLYEIKAAELVTIPTFYSDALSAVKSLSGVTSNNEMSNSFHVHGGSGNDNLILLEGIRVPQPQYIRNSYQEGMSLINPALLQNFQLMAGYFPARYGEKLHSVLIAEYHQSTDKPIRGEAEISLINAGITLEGKIFDTGYWAIASRWADTRFIAGTLQKSGDYHPKSYDTQIIGRIPLSNKHQLSVIGLLLTNDFNFKPKTFELQYGIGFGPYNEFLTELEGTEKSLFQSGIFSTILQSRISPAVSMKNYLILSHTKEKDKVNVLGNVFHRLNVNHTTGEEAASEFVSARYEFRDNELRQKSISYENELSITIPKHVIQLGSIVRQRSIRDRLEEVFKVYYELNQIPIDSQDENYSYSSSAQLLNNSFVIYVQDIWQPSPLLSVNYGVRAHFFTYNHDWTTGVRLRFKYTLHPQTWIALSWGQYAQPPEYREFRDSNHNLLTKIHSQRANQTVVSLYHRNSNKTELRAEAYYINLNHIIPYDYDDIFLRYQPEYHGTGKTYGLSLYWYGKLNKRLNSWLSYNYMVSRQQIRELGNETFPSSTDQRHTAAIVLQDDMPNIPSMRVHTRVLFGSGYPFTSIKAEHDTETGIYYPVEQKRLSLRMPYYRRIDMGMSYSFDFLNICKIKMTFEIFNIFDFRNVLSYHVFVLQDGSVERVRSNLSRRLYNFRLVFSF